MKKQLFFILITISILFSDLNRSAAQGVFYSTGFDNYNGTLPTVPSGIFISYNAASSFYSSAGNYGVAAPSYKFGNDSDFINTKSIPVVDSINFWVKGNGGPFSTQNELRFYQSADSINWNFLSSIDSIPTSGTNLTIPVNHLTGYFKIVYSKFPAGGNVAFDDLKIYSTAVVGIVEHVQENIKIYPSPSTGLINLQFTNQNIQPRIEIFDVLGNKISGIRAERKNSGVITVDLTGRKNGVYFVKIEYAGEIVTRRITITN